jgi:hypothetical protein
MVQSRSLDILAGEGDPVDGWCTVGSTDGVYRMISSAEISWASLVFLSSSLREPLSILKSVILTK